VIPAARQAIDGVNAEWADAMKTQDADDANQGGTQL